MNKWKTDFHDFAELKQLLEQSSDFTSIRMPLGDRQVGISYFKTLIDGELLNSQLIFSLENRALISELGQLEDLMAWIPIDDVEITDRVKEIQEKLMKGYAVVELDGQDRACALINVAGKQGLRKFNNTENEFSVVGPKIGFVEDMDTNIHLLRAIINIPNLVVKEITLGSASRTRVCMIYIDGVTNEEFVNTAEQRLKEIDYDVIWDTSVLDQFISDNSTTPFPLFLSTERRDRVAYALICGQVAVISDGTPYFVTGPSTLFDFFISPEDYYLPWILGSFFRLIRIFGVVFSLFASSVYVAITTFHYEIIPRDLLEPLISSRKNVPFPPVIEVLFLEIIIEFLREAGARLPTKIGQTLGIVGGIVIGQASVQAGMTSNVLVIIVTFSALASFATPIYKMSNAIRFLRYPIIIITAVWGTLGMFIGLSFLLAHLSRLTSLGIPYTLPVNPLRIKELRDSFLRLSFPYLNRRTKYLRPQSLIRYKPEKKIRRKSGFDEEPS